jgi:thiaminase (transcriptional activator TenA)
MSADGSICEWMRAESAGIWDGLHAHPFLRELAAGTLALEKFRFFLEQDELFLLDYARCCAMGAAKARGETELRYFTIDLNQVLDAELPSVRNLLARVRDRGAADRGGAATMAPANVAYASYLQAVALRGGPLEIMAALLPCAWSYVEIAQRLAAEGTSGRDVYEEWLGSLAAPANVELVASMRRDFDRVALQAGLGAPARSELARIFATSSRLEQAFWEMAYTLEQWPDLQTSQRIAGLGLP